MEKSITTPLTSPMDRAMPTLSPEACTPNAPTLSTQGYVTETSLHE